MADSLRVLTADKSGRTHRLSAWSRTRAPTLNYNDAPACHPRRSMAASATHENRCVQVIRRRRPVCVHNDDKLRLTDHVTVDI